MKAKDLWLLLALTGLLLGCGQKGPLVLPDAQHPHKKRTLPAPPKASRATSTSPSTSPPAPTSAPPTSPPEATSGDLSTPNEAPQR